MSLICRARLGGAAEGDYTQLSWQARWGDAEGGLLGGIGDAELGEQRLQRRYVVPIVLRGLPAYRHHDAGA